MFAAGNNSRNQLFTDSNAHTSDKVPCVLPPKGMTIDAKKIVDFSTGSNFSVYVTSDGAAFAVGDDHDFCIGTQNRTLYTQPTEVKFDECKEKFVGVHCGSYYTMYLTENGSLIYCSYNSSNYTPCVHKLDAKAVYVTGGLLKPIALDENGDIYIFRTSPNRPPKKYHLPEPVYDICGCDNVFTAGFIVAVTITGKVYSNGSYSNESKEFSPVESLNDIKIVRVFGCHRHCLALTEDGEILVMGANVSGQHGNNNTDNTNTFSQVKHLAVEKIVSAAVGYAHSAFVTAEGKLFTCGSNEFGQLGHSAIGTDVKVPTPAQVDGKVTHVWAGAYSTAALVDVEPPKHRGKELILKK
ncbi:hypothetical protein TRFO_19406 [Tritrichomonas foetus]|uniref:Regulator of chromosome condensation n=1 Tax=Tritrichomonas foetus TaxID=1144522 RepID=A0A1J4KIW6_9EUKA|nr:hypothetical protein TRFO_19406 [Tritrichomonas foetus]|eukprot:OHT11289.1 hypothetical protein TRFO_19406 [Tritrichomonas foetus]